MSDRVAGEVDDISAGRKELWNVLGGGGGGQGVAQLFEALRYKPEDCGFHSRLFHWNVSLT